MTKALEIANVYFALSNKSDFAGIEKLFTDSTTYSSPITGIFLGREDIMTMQRDFHSKFSSLNWNIDSIKEVKPGVVLINYDFKGEKRDGEEVESSGLEYVIVYLDKIQHIEIKNKPGA